MSPRAIVRPQVPADLENIVKYLAGLSPETADRFAEAVFPTFQDLAEMPTKGARKTYRSNKLAEVRSWPVDNFPNFLVLYRPVDVGVEVLAVLHGARDIESILNSRV